MTTVRAILTDGKPDVEHPAAENSRLSRYTSLF
jgi:hypothetical protein